MSTKATPDLDLPVQAPELLAFLAIVQVLKNDPVLGPATQTFVHWSGEDKDMYGEGDRDVSADLCPFLKISPWPSESGWITEQQHNMPLALRLQLAVRGTKMSNIMNYWNAIRLAIFPQTVAAANAVELILAGPQGNLITKPTIMLNGFAPMVDATNARMLMAVGTIKFGLLIRT